ncbi:MAG: GspH/FimT family pseudopilin [Rhodocyclaceae bacterium]|nr:GspH/FimT family pseudopilin [Rhodocyclaceae bacterium]
MIELMIALTIIGIFITLGLPSFATWLMNTQIRTAAESITNGLQLARNEAVRRNAAVQFVKGAGTDSGWTVSCVAVTPACPDMNAIQLRAAGEGSSAAITVTPSDGNTVIFDNFGMMTTPVVAVTRFDIDGANAAQSRELRVTIQAGGNVRMCDPNTIAPDPRAC